MRYLVPIILYIGLTAYVIADIAQRRDVEPYGVSKLLWVLIVLFAPFIGPAAWLIAKFINRPAGGGGRGGPRTPRPPDDDPNFRLWIDEQKWRKRRGGGRN